MHTLLIVAATFALVLVGFLSTLVIFVRRAPRAQEYRYCCSRHSATTPLGYYSAHYGRRIAPRLPHTQDMEPRG